MSDSMNEQKMNIFFERRPALTRTTDRIELDRPPKYKKENVDHKMIARVKKYVQLHCDYNE